MLLAGAHARRVASRPSAGVVRATAAIRRVSLAERPAELLKHARPGSWEHVLAEELAQATRAEARAVALDEALAEVESHLWKTKEWSATALRLALLGGLLGGATAGIATGLTAALVALGVGALGAIAAVALGRRTQTLERIQRRRADELVALLAGGRVGSAVGTAASGQRASRRGLDRNDGDG